MKLVVGVALLSLAGVGCTHQDGATEDADLGGPFFDGDGGFPFVGPQPQFGPTVTAPTTPPALSGGTLVMLGGGSLAFAADPDRDQVSLVETSTGTLTATIALSPGDEPGRAVEDAAGKVHLVLRRAGIVATIDVPTATVTERKAVCPAPRGIAYDAANDRVHVACAGGELVSLPAAGGDPVRTLTLTRDLRDVAVVGTQLWVSTLRTANIIIVDNVAGTTLAQIQPPSNADGFSNVSPAVAWRMMGLPGGKVGMVHQRGTNDIVMTTQGGYGGGGGPVGCGGIVSSSFTLIDGTTRAMATIDISGAVLPADFSYAPTAGSYAVISAGNAHTPGLPVVLMFGAQEVVVPGGPADMGSPDGGFPPGGGGGCVNAFQLPANGEPVALAYDASELLWVQTREPATLQRIDPTNLTVTATVTLSTDSRADTAWAIFHSNSGANIACASCHPEGGEDGRVWQFDAIGPRRTQSLRGHVGGTEPFHWGGELPTFGSLVGQVYVQRMAGPKLLDDQQQALFNWVNAIPTLPQSPAPDAAAVARGQAIFEDTAHAACSSCHSGPELTNNSTVDVGTGGALQVPRLLGVGWRAPFLHDGCAATLTDRFSSACGGTSDLHGATSSLTPAQIADLVAYLQTL